MRTPPVPSPRRGHRDERRAAYPRKRETVDACSSEKAQKSSSGALRLQTRGQSAMHSVNARCGHCAVAREACANSLLEAMGVTRGAAYNNKRRVYGGFFSSWGEERPL